MRKRRRNLPIWGMLLIWLVMSLGFMFYQWFLVRQDEAIAPRQQVVLGSIYKRTHWKNEKAFYSFTFEGREYKGNEMVRPDLCFCDVAVYFDPTHPTTNTLVEYRRKSMQDRGVMHACGYTSIGLAAGLAFVLGKRKARRNAAQAPQSINS